MASLNSAGGTRGGVGRFFVGLTMMVVGGYLFFDSIHVVNRFGLYTAIISYGGFHLRSGMVLVPFIIGIGMIFYNARWVLAWCLAVGSLAAFGFGVIASIHFKMKVLSAFDILTMVTLTMGGIGLFLSSLRDFGGDAPSAADDRPTANSDSASSDRS